MAIVQFVALFLAAGRLFASALRKPSVVCDFRCGLIPIVGRRLPFVIGYRSAHLIDDPVQIGREPRDITADSDRHRPTVETRR